MVEEQRPRILVVDDDPNLGVLLREALGEFAEVEEVASVRAAKQKLQEQSFDFVISDLRFLDADEDGLSLFRWIGEHKPELAKRFLLITGLEPEEPLPCPVMLKPFLFEELIARVRATLGLTP